MTHTVINQIQITTGVNKFLIAGSEFSVFPNPVSGKHLQLVFNPPGNNPAIFELYDISGRKVFS